MFGLFLRRLAGSKLKNVDVIIDVLQNKGRERKRKLWFDNAFTVLIDSDDINRTRRYTLLLKRAQSRKLRRKSIVEVCDLDANTARGVRPPTKANNKIYPKIALLVKPLLLILVVNVWLKYM